MNSPIELAELEELCARIARAEAASPGISGPGLPCASPVDPVVAIIRMDATQRVRYIPRHLHVVKMNGHTQGSLRSYELLLAAFREAEAQLRAGFVAQ